MCKALGKSKNRQEVKNDLLSIMAPPSFDLAQDRLGLHAFGVINFSSKRVKSKKTTLSCGLSDFAPLPAAGLSTFGMAGPITRSCNHNSLYKFVNIGKLMS